MGEPGARDAGGQRRRQAGAHRDGPAGQAARRARGLAAVANDAFRGRSIHAVCTRTITITSTQCDGTRVASPRPRRDVLVQRNAEGGNQMDASTHTRTQRSVQSSPGCEPSCALSSRQAYGAAAGLWKAGTRTVSEGGADTQRTRWQGAVRTAMRREIGSTLSSLSAPACVATKCWNVASSSGRSIGYRRVGT